MSAAAVAEIGHNQAPPTPFEACQAHMDDLLTEARNWADGATVENQAQADEISRLIEDLRLAAEAADGARVDEQAPHKAMVDEIQGRFNAYIAPLKNKVPGSVPLAMDALKRTLKPYLDGVEAEKRAKEAAALRAAQEAADKAAAAMRAADPTDLASREAAELLVAHAHRAESEAKRAANDKAQALGGSRALGLKRTFTANLIDRKAALVHYLTTQPDTIQAYLITLAQADVQMGKRTIPGFEVIEGTRL